MLSQAVEHHLCPCRSDKDTAFMYEKIMERPLVYNLWSSFHFPPRFKAIRAEIRQGTRPSILDLGCGTGLFKKKYPDCSYVGIDNNVHYIDYAKKNRGGHFILGDILHPDRYLGNSRFDYIITNGVLHHLDDPSLKILVTQIGTYLNPGGSIIVVDHIYHDRLNYINKMLLKYDRGSFSRSEAKYRVLFQDFNIASYKEFFIKAGPVVLWVQCRFVLKTS
jgi:SAM-dependent methyltransferase